MLPKERKGTKVIVVSLERKERMGLRVRMELLGIEDSRDSRVIEVN